MLRDGSSYLNNRRFLEGVGADHAAGDLAGDRDDRDAVEERVGEAADEVGGARAGGGDADPGEAGGARVALGGEDAALLVAREDVADGGGARERLVDLHRRAAGVGEDVRHALPLQRLHEDVRALARLVGAKSGNEICGGGCGDCCGGGCGGGGIGRGGVWGGVGEGACDSESAGSWRGVVWEFRESEDLL